MYIGGYASDYTCSPASYSILTTSDQQIIAHTIAVQSTTYYDTVRPYCTNAFSWKILLKPNFIPLIHAITDVQMWIMDESTNIAYRVY